MSVTGVTSWQVFAFASAFFAALTAIFGKLGVARLNSDLATFIRTIVILIVLSAIVSLKGEWQRPAALPKRDIIFLVLSGIATGLSWLCYYRALQLGPASRVAPVDKLSVVFAIILAVIFLGEQLTWKVIVGGSLVAAGAILMAI